MIQTFLLIWCAFVVLFFSISQSKLVTYILPIMPPLSVLIAPAVAKRASATSFASWTTFAIVAVGATGLFVAAERNVGHIPQALSVWAAVAVSLGIATAIAARFSLVAAAAGVVLAYQALMMSYSALPPVRTSKGLVATVRAHGRRGCAGRGDRVRRHGRRVLVRSHRGDHPRRGGGRRRWRNRR